MSYSHFRIGMVLYRDYKDAYLTHDFPFEYDLDAIQGRLDMITVDGGGDKRKRSTKACTKPLSTTIGRRPTG